MSGRDDPTPAPDPAAETAGYMVLVPPQERIHFVEWTASAAASEAVSPDPGIVLVHGLAGTAHAWAPVARRLCRRRRTVAMDLRGHGLSDAPTEGYEPASLAGDVVAVAEGSGLLDAPAGGVVLAGHGFGAIVAAWAAVELGARCAGLVLVDGGWEDLTEATGLEPWEFLRTIEEPPEVLASLAAYLADRKGFDPASWDTDQEEAARAAIVELPAGRVVSSTRPHALEACVEAMFGYRPLDTLTAVTAPIVVLAAAEDEAGGRTAALDGVAAALARQGRPLAARRAFPADGHNLMRYRPTEVTAAILEAGSSGGPRPGAVPRPG